MTLENDCRDSVLDVAGSSLRRHILSEWGGGRRGGRGWLRSDTVGDVIYYFSSASIDHEDRSMSNAKALLQSAWLGDAVSVKRCLVSIALSIKNALLYTRSCMCVFLCVCVCMCMCVCMFCAVWFSLPGCQQ